MLMLATKHAPSAAIVLGLMALFTLVLLPSTRGQSVTNNLTPNRSATGAKASAASTNATTAAARPGQGLALAVGQTTNTPASTLGLKEVPVRSRAGGMKADLHGRFRSVTEATIGPDGKLTLRCVTKEEPLVPTTVPQESK